MNLKSKKGITLVALVVTIIVLLILAGVTLKLISGSDGILGKANKAATETQMAVAKEELELYLSEENASYFNDKYVSETPTTAANLRAYLMDKKDVNNKIEIDGGAVLEFEDENGKITYTSTKGVEIKDLIMAENGTLSGGVYANVGTGSGSSGSSTGSGSGSGSATNPGIPPTTTVTGISAADITDTNASDYYGATVNYSSGGQSDWRLFYSDGNNLYITTRGVLSSMSLRNTYNGSNTLYGRPAANCLRAPIEWTTYSAGTGASWAYGGIPLSIFSASYSQVGTAIPNISGDEFSGFSNSLSTVDSRQDGLYLLSSNYWLASPSAIYSSAVMSVDSSGYVYANYSYNSYDVRPLVCLDSRVTLTLNSDGETYDINTNI